MSLPVILEKYRSEVESEIRDVMSEFPPDDFDHMAVLTSRTQPLYDMMRYHLGWIDEEGKPVQNNAGKALRPALCLFSCEAVGGDYRKALPAAAALELVHNFSLIHDDIQDDDRERRHRPTVWAIWGKPQAINAGTAMRILANRALLRLQTSGTPLSEQWRINRRLDDISLRLIEGQYLDISYENRFDIKVNDYMAMILGKTAALISLSMEIGASLGTENDTYINAFRETGVNLGLAFQIRDDILGIWGDQKETGKSAGNDILRRKKSFPVVYALESANDKIRERLIEIYRNNQMDKKAVEEVLEIFNSVQARARAQEMVEKHCLAADLAFNRLNLSQAVKSEWEELAQFLAGRTY